MRVYVHMQGRDCKMRKYNIHCEYKEKEDAVRSEGFDALNEDFDRRYFE